MQHQVFYQTARKAYNYPDDSNINGSLKLLEGKIVRLITK